MHTLSALALGLPIAGQPAGDGAGGLIGFLAPLLLIFVVFYFLIMRPQKKRQEEHQNMVQNLKKGDKIVTIGGVHGTVTRVDEGSILAQVDSGVKLRFDKNAVANVGGKDDSE